MAWPQDPLNKLTEWYIDGQFVDITSDVRGSDAITVSRPGSRAIPVRVTPTTLDLTLNDLTGKYNNKNPRSEYFGKIGRGTLIRHSAAILPTLEDDFNRTVSNGWTGGTLSWSNTGGTVPDDYDINGTKGTHTHPSANVLHYSTVDSGSPDHRVQTLVNLSAASLTGAGASVWALGRYTDTSNYYAALMTYETGGDITLGIYKRVSGSLSAIAGPVVTHAGYSGLFDVTQFGLELYVEGRRLFAKMWDATNYGEVTTWNLTGEDTDLPTGNGVGVVDRREAGNGQANLQIQYDRFFAFPGTIRFTGGVARRRRKRDNSDKDRWVQLQAADIMRRVSQGGSKPRRSPAFRAGIFEPTTVGYWPLENVAQYATTMSSPIPGVAAAVPRITGFTGRSLEWSTEASLVGSGSLPSLSTEYGNGGVDATIDVTPGPAVGIAYWARTDATKKNETNGIFTQHTMTLFTGGGSTVPRFHLTLLQFPEDSTFAATSDGSITVRSGSADATGASIDIVEAADLAFVDGWRHVYTRWSQSGADVAVSLWLDGEEIATGTVTGTTLGTAVKMRVFVFTQNTTSTEIGRLSVGHPIILSGSTSDLDAAAARLYAAGLGNAGETAAARIERLCAEEGVPFALVGTASDTQLVGVQRIDTFPNLLYHAADTDLGILRGARSFPGVEYCTRKSIYNKDLDSGATSLPLDFSGTDLAEDFEPTEDDDGIGNDVTVTGDDGAFERMVQTDGPLNVSDPDDDPDGVGTHDRGYSTNPYSSSQLRNIAGWVKNLGTQDEDRLAVQVNLARAPFIADTSLIVAAARLDMGDYLSVDNPPDDLPPEQIEQIVLGYTERFTNDARSRGWTIVYSSNPYAPYRVFVIGSSRLSSGGSTLTNAETSGGTAFELTTQAGSALWTTTDEPFDLMIAGERVTVTTSNDTTSPQDVTVTRSASVAKAHVAGEVVQIFQPRVIAL